MKSFQTQYLVQREEKNLTGAAKQDSLEGPFSLRLSVLTQSSFRIYTKWVLVYTKGVCCAI